MENAQGFVYLQPNKFTKEVSDTVGLLENMMVYPWKKAGGRSTNTWEVPSDWTVYVVYNVGMFSGSVIIESSVSEYTDADIGFIKTMQPTGTYHVSEAERAR